MDFEYKTTKFAAQGPRIEGHAAVFNVVDRVRDIIRPGAFAKALKAVDHLVVKYMHGLTGEVLPIGVTTELREDDFGLYFKCLLGETTTGKDVQILVDLKAVDEASFSFRPLEYHFDADGNRVITEIDFGDLKEITLADHGTAINPAARIRALKAWATPNATPDALELERFTNAFLEYFKCPTT